MIIYVKTENSMYVLDTERQTWERVETAVRTEPRDCECVAYSEGDKHIDTHCPKCYGAGFIHVAVDILFPLRTTKGVYHSRTEPVEIGAPLTLICDPLPESAPGTLFRVITTSLVEGVSYEAR